MNRLIVIFSLLIFVIGCGGPTKAGLEARAKAHSRMDSVNADLAAQQAKQQFEVGQLDKAIVTINAAIARYSENGNYHLLRGRILLEQHRLDAAYHALTKATTYSPELPEPYYFLGTLHQRWGEDEKALASYKKAMENDTSHPQYFLATAETHVALEQYDTAIDLLTSSSQEFQHHPSVSLLLGQIHLTIGQPEEAATWFEDSRMLGSENPEVLTLLATSHFSSGNYAECLHALALLQDEQESLSTTMKRIKGKCLSATGRSVEGRDLCLLITREIPDDSGSWIDLGYISWDMGDYKRLGSCGAKISQLAPDLPEGPLFEGIAALHSGNQVKANKMLSLLESDNSIHGIDTLLKMVAKNTKNEAETLVPLDLPSETAEVLVEPHEQVLVEGSQPIATVVDSPETP